MKREDMASSGDYGTCPVCERRIQVKMDGRLRMHGRERDTGERFANCRGSGETPRED